LSPCKSIIIHCQSPKHALTWSNSSSSLLFVGGA
jgi:hypothetical protein